MERLRQLGDRVGALFRPDLGDPIRVGDPSDGGSDGGVLDTEPNGPFGPPPREDDRRPVETVPRPLTLEPDPNLVKPLLTHELIVIACVAPCNVMEPEGQE